MYLRVVRGASAGQCFRCEEYETVHYTKEATEELSRRFEAYAVRREHVQPVNQKVLPERSAGEPPDF